MSKPFAMEVIANIVGTDGEVRQELRIVGQNISTTELNSILNQETGEIYGFEIREGSRVLVQFVSKPIWDRALKIFQGRQR